MSAEQDLYASLDPVDAEEAYDRRCREEADGASDSDCDDEEDAANFNAYAELQLDQQYHFDTEFHATNQEFTLTSTSVKEEEEDPVIRGAPVGWLPPQPPTTHKPKDLIKKGTGCPKTFESLDNPGTFPCFRFTSSHFSF